jgi:hypothetical protein
MKEPIITEVYISPNTSESTTDDGERKTTKYYTCLVNGVDRLQVRQNAWPDTPGGGYYSRHWTEEEWIEEAKQYYYRRQQNIIENKNETDEGLR